MNIFVLDKDPRQAAWFQCDKHIGKMPLESAQMLCAALIKCGSYAEYKATHVNHPCSVWARQSRDNFLWLCEHGIELCHEFKRRFRTPGKDHLCLAVIEDCMTRSDCIPAGELTSFALAMPDKYKQSCAVQSYRDYYSADKRRIAKWKDNRFPSWWVIKPEEDVELPPYVQQVETEEAAYLSMKAAGAHADWLRSKE